MANSFPYHTKSFSTPRLILRPMMPADLETAVHYYRDDDFRRGMESREYWNRVIDLAELQEIAEMMARQGYMLTIAEKATGRAIGEVCLQWMNMERAKVRPGEKVMRMPLGIWDKQLWGRGYGKEVVGCLMRYAFEELGIDRLCAMGIDLDNLRSQRLWLACGMRVVRQVPAASWQEADCEITRAQYQAQGAGTPRDNGARAVNR